MKGVLDTLSRISLMATQRTDIVVALFLVLAIVMMIIPLPTQLMDIFIALNITLSLLILVVAFYISHPVELSSLPSLILFATLFRLAISISTTRLILLKADAGHIISAFGNFVIAGEVVIGLVVFLIITISQFLVITKGSERVAEVAARFILDAMPGKQMSIDNDLRNGDIDAQQAKFLRNRLAQESHLFGAMDGAMKFVKGDAIASLVILFVNLLGGLLIGMVKHGMPFAESIHTYSLLTVGDGLVAQIPALMVSMAAGIVVTRVESENDLGGEIVRQLGSNSRGLGLTSAILFCLAWIPGFSAAVFLSLSAFMGGAAWYVRRKRRKEEQSEDGSPAPREGELENINKEAGTDPQGLPDPWADDGQRQRLMLIVGGNVDADTRAQIAVEVERYRSATSEQLGLEFPAVGFRYEADNTRTYFSILLDEVPVSRGDLPEGELLLDDAPFAADMISFTPQERPPLFGRRPQQWVNDKYRDILNDTNTGYLGLHQVLGQCVAQVMKRYAGEFIGIQETRRLLEHMAGDYSELVDEAVKTISLQKISEVFRELVTDGVPLRAGRSILEALISWEGENQSTNLVEYVRASLSRQICNYYSQSDRIIPAWVMTRRSEEFLRNVQQGKQNAMNFNPMRELHDWLNKHLLQLDSSLEPVVVISPDLRPGLQSWMHRSGLNLPVLSWREIAPEFDLQALAQIRLDSLKPPSSSDASARAEV